MAAATRQLWPSGGRTSFSREMELQPLLCSFLQNLRSEKGEVVLICRNDKPVAEMKAVKPEVRNRLKPDPALKVTYHDNFELD